MTALLDIAAHAAGLSVMRVPAHRAERLRRAIQIQIAQEGEGMWLLDCLSQEKHGQGREAFRRAVALGELLDQLDWYQPEGAIEKDRELIGEPGLIRWLLDELRQLVEGDEESREWRDWLGDARQQIGEN